jgi:type II secretory ATPase GspE/PulE/Tfp pilus assembly ATPase PilB-like protein
MAAAVTGHLVLSTIHTTDAPGAITRLLNMGVPPFLVAGGLSGVVAQRLVRKRCGLCHGGGCEECDGGCRGRTGVYQVLALSDAIRDAICRDAGSGTIRRLARETGMGTLASDARRAIASGLTTPHEGARLIHAADDASVACPACGGSAPADAIGCPSCGQRSATRCGCGRTLERGWRFCPWCISEVAV